MLRLSAFAFSLMFWMVLAAIVLAQEVRPQGGALSLVQAQPELNHLENEVAKAREKDDILEERDRLFVLLKEAKSEQAGRLVADAIWRNWIASAPTEEVGNLITEAMKKRRWYDFEGARQILNEAVEKAPGYSEAWNQRAYILFLQEKFDDSLEDLEEALALEPRHFGALAGKARILFHQGHQEAAQVVLKSAVDIHPWIQERVLLLQTPQVDQEPAETKRGGQEL